MRDAMDVEIALGAALVVRDLLAHALGEDLGAAARQRIETGRHQLAQHLLVGHAVQIGEERDLDRREALQMDAGTDPLEAAQQLRVVVERQIGMQAVDDVDFGERLVARAAAACPTPARATSCTRRRRRASAARTSRTGSSRRRRWSPRGGCCSCRRCARRGGVSRSRLASQPTASRSGLSNRRRPSSRLETLAGVELLGDVERGRRRRRRGRHAGNWVIG